MADGRVGRAGRVGLLAFSWHSCYDVIVKVKFVSAVVRFTLHSQSHLPLFILVLTRFSSLSYTCGTQGSCHTPNHQHLDSNYWS